MIVRALKKLESVISVSVVDYYMDKGGWKFSSSEECPGAIPDFIYGSKRLSELYFKADPSYTARFTVPVLWDKKNHTIVNNESSEIIRIFNSSLDHLLPEEVQGVTFYPENLRPKIDEINGWIYDQINDGVYKAGFARTQEAYEENVLRVFEGCDRVEGILRTNRFLVGDKLTEADIRLFTTIVRFDPVYHGHFKCNLKTITHDYPNLLSWARRIYQLPGVSETVHMDHIKKHYYMSHTDYNPTQIVPIYDGPDLSVPVLN